MAARVRRVASLLAALLGFALALPATAATITYEATNVAGNTWRYDYGITNDGADPLGQVTLWFAQGSYANLRDAIAPAGWDALIGVIDPELPADGYVDYCAFDGVACAGPGIAAGSTLGGFSIVFEWFGGDAPGSQPFDVLDPVAFEIVASGVTVPLVRPPAEVPEPGTLALLGVGLAALAARRSRRRPAALAN